MAQRVCIEAARVGSGRLRWCAALDFKLNYCNIKAGYWGSLSRQWRTHSTGTLKPLLQAQVPVQVLKFTCAAL